MSSAAFFARLEAHAAARRAPAVVGSERTLSYAELIEAATRLAAQLRQAQGRVVVSLLDNGPGWIVTDLAALLAELVHVPLPLFFTAEQMAGAVLATGAELLICPLAVAPRFAPLGFSQCQTLEAGVALLKRQAAPVAMPAGTVKITFTSGSTGAPKGVCLSAEGMFKVAQGLVSATQPLGLERHLNALPLAVLLENIAGVYAPLWQGATCITPPLGQVGLSGSSQFDPRPLHQLLEHHQANSLITLPQMLRGYAGLLGASGLRAPETLRFVAVGGASVGVRLLDQAHALGIPAYEGYGLSEGASVQTLNLPAAHRRGSAGRPLPHARVRISAAGEVEIAGSTSLGYLGDLTVAGEWVSTGDLGAIDDDGFVQVHGRMKNVLITGFGRNVSPEWVETQLRGQPEISEAVVLGDGQPALGAVLWPPHDAIDDARLQSAVDAANAGLPDYARIGPWQRGSRPFSVESGLATANGRPQRAAIAAAHPALFSSTTID